MLTLEHHWQENYRVKHRQTLMLKQQTHLSLIFTVSQALISLVRLPTAFKYLFSQLDKYHWDVYIAHLKSALLLFEAECHLETWPYCSLTSWEINLKIKLTSLLKLNGTELKLTKTCRSVCQLAIVTVCLLSLLLMCVSCDFDAC